MSYQSSNVGMPYTVSCGFIKAKEVYAYAAGGSETLEIVGCAGTTTRGL